MLRERRREKKREREAHRDQIGRLGGGKMMREMRGIWGGSRRAVLVPSKDKNIDHNITW